MTEQKETLEQVLDSLKNPIFATKDSAKEGFDYAVMVLHADRVPDIHTYTALMVLINSIVKEIEETLSDQHD